MTFKFHRNKYLSPLKKKHKSVKIEKRIQESMAFPWWPLVGPLQGGAASRRPGCLPELHCSWDKPPVKAPVSGASYSWDWLVVCHWEEFRNVGCRKEEATAFVEEGRVGHSSSFLALLHCSLSWPAVFDETQNPQILTNLSNPKLFQLGPRGGRGPSSCWQCCCCSLSWTASTTHAITAQLLTDPAFMKLFI